MIVIADGGPGFCSASPAAFDSFRAGNTVDGTVAAPDLHARQRFPRPTTCDNGQATSFAADIDYQAGDDLDERHLAAVPAGGQPSAAGRRRPGLPAGPRLRADVHRDLPRRADPHVDACSGDPRTRRRCCRRASCASTRRPARIPTPTSAASTRSRSRAARADRATRRHPAVVELPGAERPGGRRRHLPRRHRAGHRPAAVAVLPGSAADRPGPADQGRRGSTCASASRCASTRARRPAPSSASTARVPFVNLQVSHDPGQIWVLVFAITMMAGLLVSLLVRRRRVWVAAYPPDGEARYGERRARRSGAHRQLRLGRRVRAADRAAGLTGLAP